MRSRPAALALLPSVIVPGLLAIASTSLWPAVIGYHVFCLGLPLIHRHGRREAGLVASAPRRWLPLTAALSIALLAAGEVGRHVRLAPLLPDGSERVLR